MTAPAVTRVCSIFYGSFEVGGSTRFHLDGYPRFERATGAGVGRASLSFGVLVQEDDDNEFQAQCQALEEAFAARNVRVRMVMTGTTTETWPDYNPTAGASGNTGFNSAAVVAVAGTPGADHRYSRRYDVAISVDLPSPDSSGLLDLMVTVNHDSSYIRTVTIRGVYRAATTNDASAQFAAQIEATCSSVLTGISGTATFERIEQQTERDRADKSLTFSRTYRELYRNQASGTLDHASIVRHTIGVQRLWPQPGDSGAGIKRLEEFAVRFTCNVNATVTTDLDTLFEGTIKPYMREFFLTKASPRQFGIQTQTADYDHVNQVLTAELRILAAIDPTDVVESAVTSRIVENSGIVMTGVWSGGIFDKHVDRGHATKRRFTIRATRVLGAIGPKSRLGGGGTIEGVQWSNGAVGNDHGVTGNWQGSTAPGTGSGGGGVNAGLQPSEGGGDPVPNGWNLIDNDSAATVKVIGQPGGDQITITDLVEQYVEEWADEPSGGGGTMGLTPGPGGSYGGLPAVP